MADRREAEVRYPDATNVCSYYKNNLLKSAENAAGAVTNAYNDVNWLSAVSNAVPNGQVSYLYCRAGNVTNVAVAAGGLSYSCTNDAAERLALLSAPEGFFTNQYWSWNGLLATNRYPNGMHAECRYDVLDRLTNIVWRDSGGSVLRSFAYLFDQAGMITNVARETGERTVYAYDSLDRLTGERYFDAGGTVTSEYTYAYDEVGNRTNKTSWPQGPDGSWVSVAYQYSNGCNRLLGWDASSTNGFAQPAPVFGSSTETIVTNQYLGELTVSNSAGGAVQSASISDGTNFTASGFLVLPGSQEIVARVADTAGNIAQTTNTASLTVVTNAAYGYNAAGCVTEMDYTDSQGGAYRTMDLTWNGQYQLTQVSTNGAFAESYQYDALGRRISTSNSAGIVYYVHDGVHIVAEVDAAGSLTRSYTWGPGVDNLLAFTTGYGTETTNSYFAIKDHLGTVHALADEDGDIVESYRFDAWGRVVAVYDGDGAPLAQSAVGNRFLFQGREYSWATGLYYFRARWYDPVTGRWLSNDPIGISGGLDQYVFAKDDPVNRLDPYGLRMSERERRALLSRYAQAQANQARSGRITDLEAMARVCDAAASFHTGAWSDDETGFVNDIGAVLAGQYGRYGQNSSQTPAVQFRDTGFRPEYRENGGPMVRHGAAAIEAGYWWGGLLGSAGMLWREGGQGPTANPDRRLGVAGAWLGDMIRWDRIDPDEVGDWIRKKWRCP